MSLILDFWFMSSFLSSNVQIHFDILDDTFEGKSFLIEWLEVEQYVKHSPGYNRIRMQ